jgi:predicted AlkP superfamily phosphohydrolase/phosphomutase/tetratricopeptide (TPR) repeat protein
LKKNKVVVVGWDSADWKIIDKLMANGLMPAIKSIVDNGVKGKLATLDPPLSPMLWTSMATGKRPYDHGILGFVEPDGNGGIRSVSSHSRKVKAIWNIFTMEGIKSNIVGWWPSNPVESINGCMVSNLFQQEKMGGEVIELDKWNMPEGTIYPERIKDRLAELRVHPHEITGNLVMPFVPQALNLDKKKDKRLTVISKFLAHSATIHAAATELMETEPWDFTAVYHDALDHFSHGFMKFHPPQMKGITDEDFGLFKDVVIGAYIYHDMMLDRILKMTDDDTTVMVISDHGFHSDHLRPTHVPQIPSGPAIEHAPYGIIAIKGPGIKKGERIYGASVLDITPTLLSLYDLPIGKDMAGKPLIDIYEAEKKISYIDSWENVEKDGGSLVVEAKVSNEANESALQQLIDLGYIDDFNKDTKDPNQFLKDNIKENNFYLAKSYSSAGKFEEALEILLEIESREEPDFRFLIEIVNCSVKTKRFKLAEEYLAFIRTKNVISKSYIDVLESKVQIGLNNPDKAVSLLKSALNENPDAIEILLDLGRLLNSIRFSTEAETCFKKVIEKDPDNPYAYHGVGIAKLREEKYEDAIEYFLDAIDRLYHYPLAHFHLGEAFALSKMYEEAIQCFEVVQTMTQNIPKVFRWLADLNEITGDQEKYEFYTKMVQKLSRSHKKIITGLPSEKLQKHLEKLIEKGEEIGGFKTSIFEDQINIGENNWMNELETDIIYVPLNLVSSLNAFNSYEITLIEESADESMKYILKRKRFKEASIDVSLLEDLKKQERIALIWINQQPNLDYKTL